MKRSFNSTGDRWCPEVPSDWTYLPLRRVGRIVGGGTPTADGDNWGSDIPFVTPPDLRPVVGSAIKKTARNLTAKGAQAGSSVVPAGSVIVSIRAPIGYVAYTKTQSAFNQGCRALDPSPEMDERYLTYALVAAAPELEAHGRGTTFMELSAAQFSIIQIPVPSQSEQRVIVDYLDRETARIDNLIDEQERLLALLGERRQAIVAHTLIGFETTPARRVLRRVRQGWSPNCEPWPANGVTEWGILKVGCTNTGVFNPTENKRLPDEVAPRPDCVVMAGEIVMSRSNTRELVGAAAVVSSGYPRLMLSDLNYGLTPTFDVDGPFLALALNSTLVRRQIRTAAKGTSPSMQKISQRDIRDLLVPLPPFDKQRQIVAYLDEQTARIDALIAETERFIELSRERRSALITAAVTGQIDVRGRAG